MNRILLSLLSVGAFALTGCTTQRLTYMAVGAEAVQCVANFDVADDGTGSLKMQLQFPCRYWDRQTTGTVTPVIVSEGKETEFPAIELKGEKVAGAQQTIPYSTGGDAEYATQKRAFADKAGNEVKLLLRYKFTREGKTFEAEAPYPYTLSKEK